MPAIPIYTQQTQAGGALRAQATPDDFGASTAQAGSRLVAGALDAAGAVQLQRRDDDLVLKQQEEKDARSWAGVAASQATLDWTQNLQDRKRAALPGAPDFTPSVLADFDTYASKLAENAPTDEAKRYTQQHLTALRTSIGDQAIVFQGAAKVNLRLDNAQTMIDNAGKVVQQDNSQYGSALANIQSTMPEVGPEIAKKLNDKAIQTLTAAAASHALDQDPYGLQEATQKAMGANGFTGKTGVPWVDDATPDQVKSWNAAATTKINMLENAAARAAEAREKAAAAMVSDASDMTIKGQYMSPDYVTQLRGATSGTSFAAGAERLIGGQAAVSGFASAPASDRNAVLNMLRTSGADPTKGTDPESSKQVDKFATVDNEIRKAVAENPWAASQKYGVSKDAGLVNVGSVPDAVSLIKKRGQTQDQLETWVGNAVSPLQPGEAGQLSNILTAMPPVARGEALAQIGAGLPVGRLEALADQLDAKDKPQALALKLGSDQSASGRSVADLVLQGAQSLKDGTVKKDDAKLSGWRAEIAGLVRGTLGSEKAENDVIDSAYYVRAAMDNDANAAPGYKFAATNERAVALVLGQPMERNGVKTLLPRAMDESGFDKALSVYTPDKLQTMAPDGNLYLRGQPVTLQRFSDSITRYGMTRDGKGNFLPSTGGAFITTDKAGQQPLRLPVSP